MCGRRLLLGLFGGERVYNLAFPLAVMRPFQLEIEGSQLHVRQQPVRLAREALGVDSNQTDRVSPWRAPPSVE
jgi:hypothetical protein